jgi:hypothetical protein
MALFCQETFVATLTGHAEAAVSMNKLKNLFRMQQTC